MLLCTATSNGTTTTFIDALNLNHENKIFVGRQGIFSGGTSANLGRVVRVSDLVKTTQTITFTPTLPSATAISDELELWNQRDEGVTPGFVNEAINDAILDINEADRTAITSDALDFLYDSNVVAIDDLLVDAVVDGTNWKAITGIDRQDDLSDWHPIPRANLRVDRAARTVEIIDEGRYLANGYSIRVRGAYIAATMDADTDTTTIDFEWITHQVASAVVAKRMETAFDRKSLEGRYLQLQQRADAIRPKTPRRLRGAFWRLD